jgi:outer membrane biosynthesis protein TonB
MSRQLASALAASALLHATLLLALGLRPHAQQALPPVPLMIVSLRAAVSGPFEQAGEPVPVAAPAPVAAPLPEPPVPTPQPAPQSRPPPVTKAAAAEEVKFHPAEELSPAPRPLAQPEFAPQTTEQLKGRRLQIELWVGPDGAVRKSELRTGEVSPQLKQQLLDAIARARFVPGRLMGRAVGGMLRLRLCYDDDGLPDASDEDCWAAAARRP